MKSYDRFTHRVDLTVYKLIYIIKVLNLVNINKN